MPNKTKLVMSMSLGALLMSSGCDDGGDSMVDTGIAGDTGGLGDGDADAEAGDGDPGGDGDGDTGPADTGDGDGDGGTTDTGDGDPSGCDGTSPYMGGWDIGCCQDAVTPGGWSPGGIGPGTVLPDWTVTDQYGDAVRVWDFCHEAIYFEYAAMWCGSCQAHAPEVAGLFNTYDSQGLMTLTYMSENVNGGPTSQSDVQAWASTYGHNGMVVYSSLDNVWYPFGVDQGGGSFSISLPGTMLVGPGATIAKVGVPSIAEIEAVLPK